MNEGKTLYEGLKQRNKGKHTTQTITDLTMEYNYTCRLLKCCSYFTKRKKRTLFCKRVVKCKT